MSEPIKEILSHELTWPIVMGMAGKARGVVLTKEFLAILTFAFSAGYAANKFDNVLTEMKKMDERVTAVEDIKTDVAVIKSDISNIKEAINKYMDRPVP